MPKAALAGAVGPEQDRQGREPDASGVPPGLEVLQAKETLIKSNFGADTTCNLLISQRADWGT